MPETIAYRAFLLKLPLNRPIPVGEARWSSRSVMLLMGQDDEGRTAWGEAAPLDGYGPDTLEEVIDALSNPTWSSASLPPSLACALGTVEWGLNALETGSVFGAVHGTSNVKILTPAVLIDEPESVPRGATHVKIKVGRESVQSDINRILAIHEAHSDISIRLDGNGLPTREEALRLVDGLGATRNAIDFFEEPWATCFQEDIRGILDVPVAIDESLLKDNWRHADVCILKPSLVGHPASVVEQACQIQGDGRRVVLSSAFESRVGMTMVSRLAALCGDAAPGLGTYRYVADDWGGRARLWDDLSVNVTSLPSIPGLVEPVVPEEGFSRTFESGLSVEEIL